MDWEALFNTCTDAELDCIRVAVMKVVRERHIRKAQPLTSEEIDQLNADNKIGAIKMYRNRTNTSLLKAKYAVKLHEDTRHLSSIDYRTTIAMYEQANRLLAQGLRVFTDGKIYGGSR